MSNAILYCHAEEDTDLIGAGDWFFDTGNWNQCAQAYLDDGGNWRLSIDYEVAGKPLAQAAQTFATIEQCKAFVADYFGSQVVEIDPSEFPAPDL